MSDLQGFFSDTELETYISNHYRSVIIKNANSKIFSYLYKLGFKNPTEMIQKIVCTPKKVKASINYNGNNRNIEMDVKCDLEKGTLYNVDLNIINSDFDQDLNVYYIKTSSFKAYIDSLDAKTAAKHIANDIFTQIPQIKFENEKYTLRNKQEFIEKLSKRLHKVSKQQWHPKTLEQAEMHSTWLSSNLVDKIREESPSLAQLLYVKNSNNKDGKNA